MKVLEIDREGTNEHGRMIMWSDREISLRKEKWNLYWNDILKVNKISIALSQILREANALQISSVRRRLRVELNITKSVYISVQASSECN